MYSEISLEGFQLLKEKEIVWVSLSSNTNKQYHTIDLILFQSEERHIINIDCDSYFIQRTSEFGWINTKSPNTKIRKQEHIQTTKYWLQQSQSIKHQFYKEEVSVNQKRKTYRKKLFQVRCCKQSACFTFMMEGEEKSNKLNNESDKIKRSSEQFSDMDTSNNLFEQVVDKSQCIQNNMIISNQNDNSQLVMAEKITHNNKNSNDINVSLKEKYQQQLQQEEVEQEQNTLLKHDDGDDDEQKNHIQSINLSNLQELNKSEDFIKEEEGEKNQLMPSIESETIQTDPILQPLPSCQTQLLDLYQTNMLKLHSAEENKCILLKILEETYLEVTSEKQLTEKNTSSNRYLEKMEMREEFGDDHKNIKLDVAQDSDQKCNQQIPQNSKSGEEKIIKRIESQVSIHEKIVIEDTILENGNRAKDQENKKEEGNQVTDSVEKDSQIENKQDLQYYNLTSQLVDKEYGYENILKHVYNPLALQAIHGDIFIDLNYDYANSQLFGQPSLLNQYKQLISVENFEEKGLIELNLQSNYSPVYEFYHLTEALLTHTKSSLRELGQKLLSYQTVSKNMIQKGAQLKQICLERKEKQLQQLKAKANKRSKIQNKNKQAKILLSDSNLLNDKDKEILILNEEQFQTTDISKIDTSQSKEEIHPKQQQIEKQLNQIEEVEQAIQSQSKLEKEQYPEWAEEFGQLMNESYKKFEKEVRKILLELKKKNKIFFYTLRQLNLKTFGYELKKYGYSAEFLQLLGYNLQQFKTMTIRKGWIELQNFAGRIALNKMSLDLLIGNIQESVTIKTSYITSDNLELQVDGIVKQKFNYLPKNSPYSSLFSHLEFLSIIALDVQTDTMKQIYHIRHTNKLIMHQQIQVNKLILIQQQQQQQEQQQSQQREKVMSPFNCSSSGDNNNNNDSVKCKKKTNQEKKIAKNKLNKLLLFDKLKNNEAIISAFNLPNSQDNNLQEEQLDQIDIITKKLKKDQDSFIETPGNKEVEQQFSTQNSSGSYGSVFGGPAHPAILPNSEELDIDEYYSMETQILLEKFYENQYGVKRKVKRVKRNQAIEERKETINIISSHQHLFNSKTCGFRFIEQSSES